MKTEPKHTPGPWQYVLNVGPTKALIVERDGSTIFWVSNEMHSSKFAANIQFMTDACNNYERVKAELDKLATAARDLLGVIDAHNRPASCSYDFYYSSGALRAALAKLDKEEQPK